MWFNLDVKHLAIFKGDGVEAILSGKKTIESRFSKARIAPYGMISAGDSVYIKPSGGEIVGQFKVKKVIFYDGVEVEDFKEIKEKYGKQIAIEEDYWKEKENCRFGTLIFIGSSTRFITSPIKLKKKDLRGWVVLK